MKGFPTLKLVNAVGEPVALGNERSAKCVTLLFFPLPWHSHHVRTRAWVDGLVGVCFCCEFQWC